MIISDKGIMPDPNKVSALHHATRPQSKEEIMSFLCMVQSNSMFIPNLARKTVHMRELTLKHKKFIWSKKCHQEFDSLKAAFTNDALLRFFDPEINTYIFVDAHLTGLSAILSQGETAEQARPIALASRSTTPVERRYGQIDLEALSVDFGLRRFRQYIVGGPEVKLITDHKPLVSIFKNTRKGSVRSDRIKLRHQDINYCVTWQAGKNNPADYIFRHATPLKEAPKEWREETDELEKTIWLLQYSPYTEAVSMDLIIKETRKDPVLKHLKNYICKGFIPKTDAKLKPYRSIFNELTVSDESLILKGERIVLPKTLWQKAVDKAHQGGHPGMHNLKRLLRSHFWIPRLNELVERKVNECHSCQVYTNKTTKEPIAPQPLPDGPWESVNIDLFGPMPNRKHILVVQDNLSRFPAAKIVPSTAVKPVLEALDDIYTNYGTPETHRTDNGPPFNSTSFTEFSNVRGIQHTKVFPYHPQGNPAETFMKPLGKAMKAAHFNGDPEQSALNSLLSGYRSTPNIATGVTPGNMMLRKGYRASFPRTKITDAQVAEARSKDHSQRLKRKADTNLSTHRNPSHFQPGQLVLIRNHCRIKKFEPMFLRTPYTICEVDGKGLLLRSPDNKLYRRHKDDVKLFHGDASNTEDQHHHALFYSDNQTPLLSLPSTSVSHQLPARPVTPVPLSTSPSTAPIASIIPLSSPTTSPALAPVSFPTSSPPPLTTTSSPNRLRDYNTAKETSHGRRSRIPKKYKDFVMK